MTGLCCEGAAAADLETDIVKELAERRHVDADSLAKIDTIKRSDLLRDYYNIIDRLIGYEELARAVVDESARGVLDNLAARSSYRQPHDSHPSRSAHKGALR